MDDPIGELRPWHRFHVRITGLYAISVLAVLTLAAAFTWRWTVDLRLQALRSRLLDTAATVAWSVDPVMVQTARSGQADPSAMALHGRFSSLGALDPELRGIYVLKTTEIPGQLAFVVDWSRDAHDEALPGTLYDARALPVMRAGLERPVVEEALYRDAWGWSLSSYAPIQRADGVVIGLVGIDVADTQLDAIRAAVLWRTLAVYGLSLGLVGLSAVVVGRSVRDPLGRTIRATTAIARGELGTRLGLDRTDEFGVLGSHFDGMARGLEERERIRGTFGRYVSAEVATQLLAQPGGPALGGEDVTCTILFSDLRGYSTVSERISPTELVALLNAYLAGMQEVIDAHQGTVIEFLGDAILAVFGTPVARPEHAEAAVRCALGMRARIAALNREWDATGVSRAWREAGLDALVHRVGVHTGQVLAGNLGSATRMKFTVIGDAVNVASRLEQLASTYTTDVLVSGATVAALGVGLQSRCVDQGEVEVKGRQQSVRVYSLSEGPWPPDTR